MERMYELKEMLCHELENMTRKGNLKSTDLETVHVLTDTIKNIMKIDALGGGEYSQSSGRRYGNSYGNSYNDGYGYSGKYSRGEDMGERIEEMMRDPHMSSSDKSALRKAMELLR